MNDIPMLWLVLIGVVLALLCVSRWEQLRLAWTEFLRLAWPRSAVAEAPPEHVSATPLRAGHEAPPQRPAFHRSGRRH